MTKSDVALIAGLAGFLLGGAGTWLATRTTAVVRTDRAFADDMLGELGDKLSTMDTALTDLTRRIDGIGRDPSDVLRRLDALEAKVASNPK